jgi:hypothetical protein
LKGPSHLFTPAEPTMTTPAEMIQGLLRGIQPPRPLFLPIAFALGAKIENVPLRTFAGNATKITSSLRQIHRRLGADGPACYFDPFLEAEALGGTIDWDAAGQPAALCWPAGSAKGELPSDLRSAEGAVKSGRVPVAVDVIRRFASLDGGRSVLMAVVSGPLTLAARLMQVEDDPTLSVDHLAGAALELAASTIRQVAASFAEADANVILIQEQVLPPMSELGQEVWASHLAPIVNTIRFYESLPVLTLTDARAFDRNRDLILGWPWDCVVCPPTDSIQDLRPISESDLGRPGAPPADQQSANMGTVMMGVALPTESLEPDRTTEEDFERTLNRCLSPLQPVIMTTAGDVSATADTKRLIRISRRISAGAAA